MCCIDVSIVYEDGIKDIEVRYVTVVAVEKVPVVNVVLVMEYELGWV